LDAGTDTSARPVERSVPRPRAPARPCRPAPPVRLHPQPLQPRRLVAVTGIGEVRVLPGNGRSLHRGPPVGRGVRLRIPDGMPQRASTIPAAVVDQQVQIARDALEHRRAPAAGHLGGTPSARDSRSVARSAQRHRRRASARSRYSSRTSAAAPRRSPAPRMRLPDGSARVPPPPRSPERRSSPRPAAHRTSLGDSTDSPSVARAGRVDDHEQGCSAGA